MSFQYRVAGQIQEAIKLSVAKAFTRGFDKKRYASYFDKFTKKRPSYRIYLSIHDVHEDDVRADRAVDAVVRNAGYTIDNYKKGLAVDKHGRLNRIGKILKKSGRDDVLKIFNEDPKRATAKIDQEKTMVVISRHPVDVAGMSTGRGWTSCQAIPGACPTDVSMLEPLPKIDIPKSLSREEDKKLFVKIADTYAAVVEKNIKIGKNTIFDKFPKDDIAIDAAYAVMNHFTGKAFFGADPTGVKKDIQNQIDAGVLVAYLIKSNDRNIQKPSARLVMRPYINDQGKVVMASDKMYGQNNPDLLNTVNRWLREFNRNKLGSFRLAGLQNPDTLSRSFIRDIDF